MSTKCLVCEYILNFIVPTGEEFLFVFTILTSFEVAFYSTSDPANPFAMIFLYHALTKIDAKAECLELLSVITYY